MNDLKETYLGDGLYASFDGYHIRLYTSVETFMHEVFLEPDVLQAFQGFVARLATERGE